MLYFRIYYDTPVVALHNLQLKKNIIFFSHSGVEENPFYSLCLKCFVLAAISLRLAATQNSPSDLAELCRHVLRQTYWQTLMFKTRPFYGHEPGRSEFLME